MDTPDYQKYPHEPLIFLLDKNKFTTKEIKTFENVQKKITRVEVLVTVKYIELSKQNAIKKEEIRSGREKEKKLNPKETQLLQDFLKKLTQEELAVFKKYIKVTIDVGIEFEKLKRSIKEPYKP